MPLRIRHNVFSRPIKRNLLERNKLENSEKTQRSFTVVLDGFEVFSVKYSNRYAHCRIQFKISLVSLASRSLSLGPHLLNLSSDSVRLTLTSLRYLVPLLEFPCDYRVSDLLESLTSELPSLSVRNFTGFLILLFFDVEAQIVPIFL